MSRKLTRETLEELERLHRSPQKSEISPEEIEKVERSETISLAVEGIRFLIPSLGADSGGRVMRFESEEDLEKTKAYYDELGRSSAAFFSWTFAEGLTLVQINGELAESKARRYEDVLRSLG